MQILIKEVATKKDLKIFYQFQNKLYKKNKQYVPSLDSDQKKVLTQDPALEYCTRKMWLAYKNGKVAGRIMCMVNPRFNKFYKTAKARFGWFDFIEDFDVAAQLVNTAIRWAREQGMNELHGPLAYNNLGRQGMLLSGYENTPPINCIYNYPYYVDFMNRLGFEKEADWIQYKLNAQQGAPEKLFRIASILKRRYNLHVLDLKKIKKKDRRILIDKFFNVYNECFQSVHNFIPLTKDEISKTGNFYINLLKPELTCIIMDENDDIAAFGICIPSFSETLKKMHGRIYPFNWLRLLYSYYRYKNIDLMMVGSNPKWASRGLSAIYHLQLAESFKRHHIQYAITNPQIDTNLAVKVWENYDHTEFMRRRCWTRKID
ncbi:MAG: hypothetical protein LKI53_01425 [Bacteroidales bacterium]|jgi:hypothetical protein|nr:hypothetical protein [Bacteroidales bacterium]